MPYDEESIRKAKDKGIFNDSFDPLALGLSEDEKKRMARGFEGAQRDLLNKAESADPKSGRKKGKQGCKTYRQALFERLLDFYHAFTACRPLTMKKRRVELVALKDETSDL